jgi:hypothetical protein
MQERLSLTDLSDPAISNDDHEKALGALASAQEEITSLKDARREERVGWLVICTILFDWAVMMNAANATAPLIIGVLELALLALAAKRLGVEEFHALFTKAMHRMADVATGKGQE